MKFTFNLLTFILFTIPLSIVTGPFLPDLSIVLALFLYVYLIIKKEIKINLSIYLIVSLIFFTLIIISFLNSFSENTLSGGYLFYLRFSLLGLMIFSIINKDINLLNLLYPFLSLLLFVISCDAIFQYITGYNLLGYRDMVENRISGFFKSEYILGKYLFFTSVVYIYLYLKLKKKYQFFFYLNFFLITFALILSGERTSIILFIMFITLLTVLNHDINIYKKLFISLFIPLIILIIVISNQDYLNRFYPGFEISLTTITNPIDLLNMSNKYFYNNFLYYIDFIKVSFFIFSENILLGIGPKMYRVECINYLANFPFACSTHPHNTYLQLLSETGIFTTLIIFSLWLLFLFLIIKQFVHVLILKKPFLNQNLIIFIIAYFVMLFPFLPNNSFFNNNSSILLYFPSGFFLYELFQSRFKEIKILNIRIIE